MGFADRVPGTSGCLQYRGNDRKAVDPIPKEGEAILNTAVSRDWSRWKDKKEAGMENKVKNCALCLSSPGADGTEVPWDRNG